VKSYDKPKPEMFFVDDLSSGEYFVFVKIGTITNVLRLIVP
jgi:hypothetical protein